MKEAPILLVGNPDSITKVSAYINENLAEGGTVYIIVKLLKIRKYRDDPEYTKPMFASADDAQAE